MARHHIVHDHTVEIGFLPRYRDDVLSFGVAVWVIWGLFAGQAIQGWASTLLIITIFSAMIITSLGIIGEYIGKIYQEVKQRPRYIIERTTGE